MASFVEDMNNNVIPRTPLLQLNQIFRDLNPGVYQVTDGRIHVGYLGKDQTLKIVGVMVDGFPERLELWNYQQGNQPFNTNFTKVLYEMRTAGKPSCSYNNLDYAYAGRDLPQANLNAQYLRSFQTSNSTYGEARVTNKII